MHGPPSTHSACWTSVWRSAAGLLAVLRGLEPKERDDRYIASGHAPVGLAPDGPDRSGAQLRLFRCRIRIARAIGSVSLFADSIDFLEDTSVNLLIFLGLAWSERARAGLGMVLALVLPGPSSTIRCRLRQSCLYSPASARWWSTSPARCSLQNSAITAAV